MATKVERKQGYSGAGYGQLALHHGQTLLIMGNTINRAIAYADVVDPSRKWFTFNGL